MRRHVAGSENAAAAAAALASRGMPVGVGREGQEKGEWNERQRARGRSGSR